MGNELANGRWLLSELWFCDIWRWLLKEGKEEGAGRFYAEQKMTVCSARASQLPVQWEQSQASNGHENSIPTIRLGSMIEEPPDGG